MNPDLHHYYKLCNNNLFNRHNDAWKHFRGAKDSNKIDYVHLWHQSRCIGEAKFVCLCSYLLFL